ncbi:hypothetical protein [Paenibacillus sp. B-A-8]|uniref:hypothetical protein n=1 Tax=Paenibacillus sp. B-A-8 TaxID=3400419 RepID=UPI003B01B1F5
MSKARILGIGSASLCVKDAEGSVVDTSTNAEVTITLTRPFMRVITVRVTEG